MGCRDMGRPLCYASTTSHPRRGSIPPPSPAAVVRGSLWEDSMVVAATTALWRRCSSLNGSLTGQESSWTVWNCRCSAVSDLHKQQLLISLSPASLYFFTQQPDHIIPLPKNAPLAARWAQNKLQALHDGLLGGPSGPGPCLPCPPVSLLSHSSLCSSPAGLPAVPRAHLRIFAFAPCVLRLAPCNWSLNSNFTSWERPFLVVCLKEAFLLTPLEPR